ncbi:MAG TPA: hypothetical protein VMR70_00005, partial [Flavisolibacter sp.]|nr:hypothetical protein [Flavisolibacter sp.]
MNRRLPHTFHLILAMRFGNLFKTTISLLLLSSCQSQQVQVQSAATTDSAHSCMNVPARFASNDSALQAIKSGDDTSFAGMVFIPGGTFEMGGDNEQASPDEFPKHTVQVSP